MKKSHRDWVKSAKGIGWPQLYKESVEFGYTVPYSFDKGFTVDELENKLINMFEELWNKPKKNERHIVFARHCDYRGWVKEDSKKAGMNSCGKPDCKGCNTYGKLIDEAVKKYIDNNFKRDKIKDSDFILHSCNKAASDYINKLLTK
jgi:hypothetical protein